MSTKTFFECKIIQGHIIKILFEILNYKLKKVKFTIRKDGIYLCENDSANEIQCEIFLDRNKFMAYKYFEDFVFSINVPDFLSNISNIKAGNSLEIKIIYRPTKHDPELKQYFLLANTYNKNDSQIKERSEINIQYEGKNVSSDFLGDNLYHEYPVNIESSSLKYLKKIKSSKKPITISIQYVNAGISLEVSAEITTLSRYFGQFNLNEPCDFQENFSSSLIIPISKISNLSHQVSFYTSEPNFNNYSLKIRSNINELGYFNFYIRDEKQLAHVKSAI